MRIGLGVLDNGPWVIDTSMTAGPLLVQGGGGGTGGASRDGAPGRLVGLRLWGGAQHLVRGRPGVPVRRPPQFYPCRPLRVLLPARSPAPPV